ncbi:MAG TPA: ABC transporter permease [Steroidobacteraceae bacterium]
MHAALTVFYKEVRENLRDRRTLLNALVRGPFLLPVLFLIMFNLQIRAELQNAEKPLPVPVVGAAQAPHLVAALTQMGMVLKPAPKDPDGAVQAQRDDVVLVIPPDYAAHWNQGETVGVRLIYDSSHRASDQSADRLRDMLDRYARLTGAQRMIARGLSPSVATPLIAEDRDQATPRARGALLFSFLPYFIVMTAFLGGMYLAIDTTAGERERQSLEPLFANPVPRWTVLLGKLSATTLFALVSLSLGVIGFAIAGRYMDVRKLNMVLDLGVNFFVFTLLLMLPLVLLLTCLQTLVSAFAKSYREALTYLSLLMLVPMLPSFLLLAIPVKEQPWMYAVPLLGQQLGIMRLLRGEVPGFVDIAACLLGGLLAAAVAFAISLRVYASERLAVSA